MTRVPSLLRVLIATWVLLWGCAGHSWGPSGGKTSLRVMPSEGLGAFTLADLPCFGWRFVVGMLPHRFLTLASDPVADHPFAREFDPPPPK